MAVLGRRLLALPVPPTAAFCVNDHLAQALLVVLHRQGVPVPSRFSIAGFDGLDYMPTPQRLTTVRRPTEAMGREAVRLLLARHGAEPGGPPRHVVLPTELRVGETTAAAPPGAILAAARGRKGVEPEPARS
jgi:DNA-binding LacI/PurR family transcriptional regulator